MFNVNPADPQPTNFSPVIVPLPPHTVCRLRYPLTPPPDRASVGPHLDGFFGVLDSLRVENGGSGGGDGRGGGWGDGVSTCVFAALGNKFLVRSFIRTPLP